MIYSVDTKTTEISSVGRAEIITTFSGGGGTVYL